LKHPQINYNLRDSDGNTALTLAVAQMPEPLSRGSSRICNSIGKPDHSTIVKLLLKQPNIDLNVVMSHGNSLISTLWEKLDHMSFLKVLNLNGGDIDLNIQDRDGSTLLFNAIMGDDGLIVLLLATNPKVNPNIQNNENETALMYAVIHNNTSAIQSLLKHPRINIKLKNKAGKTAWDMASSDIRHMFPKLKPKGV
jgi:ankyrin repeat protein